MIERSAPAYKQVADAIQQRIESGEIKPGEPIPSVRAIAAEWGVSGATAQRAHQELRSKGLTTAVQGVGSVVGLTNGTTHDRVRTAMQTGKIYGPGEWARIVSSEMLPAPTEVAQAMALDDGAQVIRRERITHKEDRPVSCSISWMPGWWAEKCPELLTTDRIEGGAQMLALQRNGLTLVGGSGHEELWAGPAEEMAAHLGVTPETIVLRSCNSLSLADGTVIEYATGAREQGRRASQTFPL